MVKNKVKKIILSTLLALSLVIICVSCLVRFNNINTEAYYNEPSLSPEDVIEKYYDGCNSRNKSKVKSTLTGYLKDGSIEFDTSNNMQITSIKEDLNKDQVTALMDTIISKNIFLTKNGALTKKSGAQLTRKAVTKFELA